MLVFRPKFCLKGMFMATEVHIQNGNRKGVHRLVGQSGFDMMTVPQSPRQVVISQNLLIGETVRMIDGQIVICVSVGNLELGGGVGLGSSLGPNHSYTISK